MIPHALIVGTLFFLCQVLGYADQIYKWTDSNGGVHFSDKPHDGAEEVVLPNVQTFSVPKPPVLEAGPELGNTKEDNAYSNISIVQPEDQTTIRNTQGFVPVKLEVTPPLKTGDQVQLLFDGDLLGDPQSSLIFELRDIKRGSHTLSAQLTNQKGDIIKTSDQITIFMMPPRVGMGRNNHH